MAEAVFKKRHPESDPSAPPDGEGLHYPFRQRPPEGEVVEVKPGIFWLRMPLPMIGLEFINLWLLADGDGWTIVDTGLRTKPIRDIWQRVFDRYLGGKPVKRIICTHFHPDHTGQAGWIASEWQAPLWMTLGEWSFGRMLWLDAQPDVPDEVVTFYRRAAVPESAIDSMRKRGFGNFRKGVHEFPPGFRRIVEAEEIRIGDHVWRVIVGRGHSPEHACLYCPTLNALISGDQVLPRISPHIGVYATEPEGNPLGLYLRSLSKFDDLPHDTLVLPAHNDPFVGLVTRVARLRQHHRERLDTLLVELQSPKRIVELLPSMFRRPLDDQSISLASGEAIAHVHALMYEGLVARELAADGTHVYRAVN